MSAAGQKRRATCWAGVGGARVAWCMACDAQGQGPAALRSLSPALGLVRRVVQADVTATKYRGAMHAATEIYASKGLLGFYSGGLARTVRTW